MSNALTVMADKLATRFNMAPDGEVLEVLKATAFKSEKEVTNAQMTALLVVANQYGLNPWTREVYAFPDKRGGIVPVVGVDGWSRIINEHPQFDGMDFEITGEQATCIIYRKDRSHPTRITEYLAECTRGTDPWKSHPRRMLRHKAMIQCARLAFGFVGIFDGDEAERIVANGLVDGDTGEIKTPPVSMPQRKSQAEPAKTEAEDIPFKEPAATGPAESPQAASTGNINAGQVKYLTNKIASVDMTAEQVKVMLGRHGAKELDTSITVEQFDAIRAELMKVGA